jgi:hypothetical protein
MSYSSERRQATREETAVINVQEGVSLDIRVEYITTLAEERHGWDMDRAGTQNAVIKGVVGLRYLFHLLLLKYGLATWWMPET